MKLVAVQPAALHLFWGWVRNGLLHCFAKSKQRDIPEERWAGLMSGRYSLFLIQKDGDDVGFVVLQRATDIDGPALFVMDLWGEPQALIGQKEDVYSALAKVAEEIGAKRIRMQSGRKGWPRWGHFAEVARIYEWELGESR